MTSIADDKDIYYKLFSSRLPLNIVNQVYTVLFLFSGTSAKHHVSLNTRSRKKYTDNEANLTNNTKYSTKAVVYPFEVLFAHVRFIMVMSNN